MFLERAMILLAALLLALAGVAIWRAILARRLRRLGGQTLPETLVGLFDTAGPAFLYFTTDSCVQCRYQQRPILDQLAARLDAAVQTVDAVEHEQLARYFGIMTVPTTVLLDRGLRPVAINHGVASLPQLEEQWRAAMNGS